MLSQKKKDDDLHKLLVSKVPDGAKLFALMDCCHSGTGLGIAKFFFFFFSTHPRKKKNLTKNQILDLPYTAGGITTPYQEAKKRKKQKKKMKKQKLKKGKNATGTGDRIKHSRGVSVCLSGCMDSQQSADMRLAST